MCGLYNKALYPGLRKLTSNTIKKKVKEANVNLTNTLFTNFIILMCVCVCVHKTMSLISW